MNNEPVAWMSVDLDGRAVLATYEFETAIPLYTHPTKTLTDAETALKSLYEAVIRYENLSPFPNKYAMEACEYQLHDAKEKARAILKKAQKNE